MGDTGLTPLESKEGVLNGLDIRVAGARLYSNSGQVMELPSLAPVHDFGILAPGPVLPLLEQNRVLFMDSGGFATASLLALRVFDATTGENVETLPFPPEFPIHRPLIHCGGDRLAFRAQDNSPTPNRVVILRTSAIPASTEPADLQSHLSFAQPVTPFLSDAEFRMTVTNAGPGAAERVHYALNWVGGKQSLVASRGTVSHDFYGGIRGVVDRLNPGETVEVVFRSRPMEAGRFPVRFWAYSSAPDPVPSNDSASAYLSVSWAPRLDQTVFLRQSNAGTAMDASGRRLFVSAPDGVVDVDPASGTMSPGSRFGPNPGALAVAADDASLWVAFDSLRTLRRHRLSDGLVLQVVAGLPGTGPIQNLVAHPSLPDVVAFTIDRQVYLLTPEGTEPIYGPANTVFFHSLALGSDGALILSREISDGTPASHPLERVATTGPQRGQRLAEAIDAAPTGVIRIHSGRVYLDAGDVRDVATLQPISVPGPKSPGSPALLADAGWVASLEFVNNLTLHLSDLDTLNPVRTTGIGGWIGQSVDLRSLAPWGADGLLFRTELGMTFVRLGALPVPAGRDFDGDGLTDLWEWEHNLNPNLAADAMADPDGDGVSTRDEVTAGTDFQQAASVLKLLEPSVSGNVLKLRFDGVAGRRYQLEGTGQLGAAWEPVGNPVLGSDARVDLELPLPNGVETIVYRLRVTMD